MDDEKNENKENTEKNFSVDTEQLKNETKDTVNKVKDTIKNTNFKEEAVQTKGFIAGMAANPIETVKHVASGDGKVFTKAVVIMIIYMALSFLQALINVIKYGSYRGVFGNIINLVLSVINPIMYILVPAIVVLIMNKQNKKPLTTVISTLVIAAVPSVINKFFYIIDIIFISNISIITTPIETMFSAIAIVLTYFGMKELFGAEEHENFIKKYAVIELIAAFILKLWALIG